MNIDSIGFRGQRCFKKEWAGFSEVRPINVIIGRNNTGKSHLLDLVEAVCRWSTKKDDSRKNGFNFRCVGTLEPSDPEKIHPTAFHGVLIENIRWPEFKKRFVAAKVAWEYNEHWQLSSHVFLGDMPAERHEEKGITNAVLKVLNQSMLSARHKLAGSLFRRLLADRDILPEPSSTDVTLDPKGRGATNIIRRLILTSSPVYRRETIEKDLLAALNKVFGPKNTFNQISIQEHDEPATGTQNTFEVFLGEDKKGLIPLGLSGSGLKTVLLVLLNLLVIPEINKTAKDRYVFAFEELENNLHPALLRRLFKYLEEHAVENKTTVFLTTHSSTALDVFGASPNAQIIGVTHDGGEGRVTPVAGHFDRLGLISELGAKPSDLLQANGIVWVEGPSDRVYINKWIQLQSGGRFREGRDYQCAFYGGALLARVEFKSPEETDVELVNLLTVNPHIVVVCDGDRISEDAPLKDRVRRILGEVRKIPDACIWTTLAREIENYAPGAALAKALKVDGLPDPEKFESFFPKQSAAGCSYIEKHLSGRNLDKVELAMLGVPHMDKEMMSARFDWAVEMGTIVERIAAWNE